MISQIANAVVAGQLPNRWAHGGTGDNQMERGAAWAEPLFQPMPAAPHTCLSRCLTGMKRWEEVPRATVWLLRACRNGTDAVERAEMVPIAEHRTGLPRLFATFEAHLRSLAQMSPAQLALPGW